MALITEPNHLAREVTASADALKRHLSALDPMVQAYHGRAWDNADGGEPIYQSHVYEYVSLMLPRMVHQSPQFTIDTTRGKRQQEIAEALERGMNHWATASRLFEPLEEIAQDALFGWGGAFIEEVPNDKMQLNNEQRSKLKGSVRRPKSMAGEFPEDAEKPHWPRVRRMEPGRWGWDTAATREAAIRFYWHKVTEDLDDLEARAKAAPDDWNMEEIELLQTTQDPEELGYADSGKGAPDRRQVTYYVIWVPDGELEEDAEDDEHGVIYTLASATKGEETTGSFLRRPYYFYGPPQGPYCKVGFYRVPGSTVPLSPLVATDDQADIVGRVNKAMVKRVERYGRKVLFDLKDKKDVERIQAASDDTFVGVTGLDRTNVVPVEVGGVTQQDLGHHAFLLDRLQSAAGMDDVQRGNVTGQGTATEVAMASEASQVRVGFMVQKWRQFVADCATRVAWYAAHDDRVIFTYKVEDDAREQMAQQMMEDGDTDPEAVEVFRRYGSATFEGGEFKDDDELAFEDLALSISPYSMQRRDQRSRKMDTLEALNLLTQYVGAAASGAPIDIGKVAELLSDVYALPELEDCVNREMAQQLGILAMEERIVAMQADTPMGRSGGGGRNAEGGRASAPGPNGTGSPQRNTEARVN